MKIAILFLTIDRYELTSQSISTSLANSGHSEYDVFVADNGSKDIRTLEFIRNSGFHYVKEFGENMGVAKAFNHLMYKAKDYDAIVLLGNDIVMPGGWLSEWIKVHNILGNETGIVGIECAIPPCPESEYKGLFVHKIELGDRVFGCWYIPKLVIDKVGYFFEYPGTYGIEDSDYNERVTRSGFTSFYLSNRVFKSFHLDSDVGNKTEYREMKDRSLQINGSGFLFRLNEYYAHGRKLYHNPFEY